MTKDTDFDPAREIASLSQQERRYILCTPLQQPTDAGVISYRAGDLRGGHRFAGFARRQAWLFQRLANCCGTAFSYRLSQDGAVIAQAIRDSDEQP